MCLALVVKVKNIRGRRVVVEGGREVGLALVGRQVKKGDYLLVKGDLAVEKVSQKEALMYKQLLGF